MRDTPIFCFFPDIQEAFTDGENVAECIEMAEDVLCLMLYERELHNQPIPDPTDIHEINQRPGDAVLQEALRERLGISDLI